MFKLKPGNVFQKLNKMDKKQAYTWGAIVVVCFIALITLASFLGDADDSSFDGFNTRGYDLAQMPFINDEAEEYLLASKYPDMKNNGSTMLYSQAEKEARQEADAEAAAEVGIDSEETSSSDSSSSSSGGYSSRGYTGGGRGGGTGTPTQVGQLGSASMGHAGGSGMSGTFGAPRGDFSPYKSQEKGSEIQTQLKNTDARRALSQFAQTSRAAAGLKDNKNANAKRALMGGSIRGSEAFTDSGVDLSKTAGLELDTNAPVSSADLSNLDKAVSDATNKGKQDKDDFLNDLQNQTSFWEQLGQNLLMGLANAGIQAGIGAAFDGLADARANHVGNNAVTKAGEEMYNSLGSGLESGQMDALTKAATDRGWGDPKAYFDANPGAKVSDFIAAEGRIAPTPTKTSFPIGGDSEAMTRYWDQQKSNLMAQADYDMHLKAAELRVGANKQAFMDTYKSSPVGQDVYTSARMNSRENNFWAGNFSQTFQGVFSQSFSQAMSNTMGGGNNNGGGYNYSNNSSRRSSRNSSNNSCPEGYAPKTTKSTGAGGYGSTETTECVEVGS